MSHIPNDEFSINNLNFPNPFCCPGPVPFKPICPVYITGPTGATGATGATQPFAL